MTENGEGKKYADIWDILALGGEVVGYDSMSPEEQRYYDEGAAKRRYEYEVASQERFDRQDKNLYKELRYRSDAEQKQEYDEKEAILDSFCEQVSPETLYEDIFGCELDEIMPVVMIDSSRNYTNKHILKMTISEAINMSKGRSDMLLGGATYYNEFISKRTAKDIYAFIIDMDNVYSNPLKTMLQKGWARNSGNYVPPEPTYIVNSGTGLHLYFVLDRPLPAWNKQKANIDRVYKALCDEETTKRPYVKWSHQWFGQCFRIVGGNGKKGWENKAYRYGKKWDIDNLAWRLGLKDIEFRHEEDPFEPKKKVITKKRVAKKRSGYYLNEAVYNNTLARCRTEVFEGHRYTSMCALSVIAWKCKIPLTQLESDLNSLLPLYNQGARTKVDAAEIESAIKMYNERAINTPRERTEEWLGWKYKTTKRNYPPRKRETTHQEYRRGMKQLKKQLGEQINEGRPSKKELVAEWRASHPEGKKIECERELGISRHTVLKWWSP